MYESLPHGFIAPVALGLGVFLFSLVGVELFRRGWSGYEEKYISGAERTLDSMYLTMPGQHVFYLSLLCGAFASTVFFIFTGGNWALALPLGLVSLGVPYGTLMLLKRQRDREFGNQLVDSLMSISNSMKAGFTLPQAFDVLAREMPNPMRQEMRVLTQELRLGVEVDEALRHLAQRMPSQEMDLIVSAVSVVRNIGGNLSEVFENIAGTIRDRQRIEGRIASLTAQGRLQAILIACLPVVAVFAMNYFMHGQLIAQLTGTNGGRVLVLSAAVMEIVGVFWIRKIVSIDV